MENLNTILLVIASLAGAAIVHLLLKPKSKLKQADTKAFDSLINDDGWAEEEEDEKKELNVPLSRIPSVPSAGLPTPAVAPDLPKKVNEGPFNIGDRVILKNLVSAEQLNGRHGVIADLWDKKTERYPIDLDLLDPSKKKPLSVKVGNLSREPSTNDDNRAKVVQACLEESHARAASFIFSALRGSIQNSLKGEKDPQKLSAFGWQFWKTKDGKGVYPSLREFLCKGILLQNKLEDLEKQLSTENPKGAYQKVTQAMNSELAVASWHVRVEGAFWIVGISPDGTLVVPAENTRQVYCVLGFKMPLGAQGKFPRPPKFRLTLLPWYGRLIHDPMLMTTTGNNHVELATPQLTAELITSCKLAQQEGRVLSRLAQLEVEGGSKEGLPFRPFKVEPMKMDPATEEERILVDNLTDFESAPEKLPTSVWNFIRAGITEDNNPKHTCLIVNGKGEKIGEFTSSALEPSPTEVLKALVKVCAEKKQRPRVLGLDNPSAIERLRFLLVGVKNMALVQVNVTRKPKADQ
eukprot:scaffold3875_cov123-Cylindrotheca_fusiformis.AAC.16